VCEPLNQEGITNFFRKNIAKAKAFRDKINIIIQQVENYLDNEDPITSESFIWLANDIMNVRDIARNFKNISNEERKEAEYEWIYSKDLKGQPEPKINPVP
jgi:hypothetical protein